MPKGIPLTEIELDRRRHEISNAAMKVFVEKGFTETSMRDIANASRVGKSTIYDYFPSKDEILIAYVVDEVGHMTAAAEEILAQDLSAGEKFRRILRKHMEYLLTNKSLYMRLAFESQRLSFENQQRIQRHRHAYQDMLCELVGQGIQDGEFRPVNPLIAVRGMFSLLTSFIYTSRPTGSPEEMIGDAFEIFFKGLEA
jgi:AcrR family transcriptional regulator